MNKQDQTISSSGRAEASVDNDAKRVLRLGLDMHYRQVTVAMQEDGGRIKAAGKMSHVAFLELGEQEVGRGLANLELLRSRS